MAGSSVIGALRVVLGIDTAAFYSGLKSSKDSLAQFGADVAKAGAAIGVAVAAIGVAVGAAVTKSLAEAGRLNDLAQKIGIPVEQLSALKYAAELSGSSLDGLVTGVQQLSRSMQDAASNALSPAALAFKAIGINVRDAAGQMRPTADILNEIADKFQGYQDGASKTALALTLLGKSGGELIPLLNKGSAGIKALTDEARELGITITSETAGAASEFNDTLTRLWKTKDALVLKISGALLPALQSLSGQLLDLARDTGKSNDGLSLLVGSIKVLVNAAQVAVASVAILSSVIRNLWQSIKGDESADQIITRLKTMWADITATISDTGARMGQVWDDAAAKAPVAAATVNKGLAPVVQSAKDIADKVAAARAELQAFIALPYESVSVKMAAVEEALKAGTLTTAQAIQMQAQLTKQAWEELRNEQKLALDDLINSPTETFTAKMQAAEAAVRSGTIGFREFGKMVKQVTDENTNNWTALGSQVSQTVRDVFGQSKAGAVASTIIDTAVGITKALAQGGMFGWAQAALIGASGIAQLTKIKSTQLGGGGSAPSVGGGAGDAAAPPAMPAALQQTLLVQGINPGDIFSGDVVRSIAEKLLQYQRDGGRVVLT